MRSSIRLALLASAALCGSAVSAEDLYRPAFHFTPPKNWMNDPNGLVWLDGEYHLFYQHNPFGDQWGHMSWGHAVSKDLVTWEHLPLALAEENNYMIFSGSAVYDKDNTSGFGKDGKGPLIAIYTGHATDKPLQNQWIAYSNDKGRTWTKYEGNPVIDLGKADFRDPKVRWHAETKSWVMTVVLPHERKALFYRSPDLKKWEKSGEFGPAGSVKGVWECPDLFPLKIEGGGTKWVLIVSVGSGQPFGGNGIQYFTGEFDGNTFISDDAVKVENSPPQGRVLFDFEDKDYAGWTVTGDAFGPGPAKGTLDNQQPVSGFSGAGLVNSYFKGDDTTGTLTSPPFRIETKHLNFLIGAGAYPGETCMNLLVDGKAVRTATGDEDERLDWKSWDVAQFSGKEARVEIVDKRKGHWGHINVDRIMAADAPAKSSVAPAKWADFGKDFYAAVSWSGVPDGRELWLGWMTNFQYASATPTSPWRGAMSCVREMSLRKTDTGLVLAQKPVQEMDSLFGEGKTWTLSGNSVDLAGAAELTKGPFLLTATLEPSAGAAVRFGLRRTSEGVENSLTLDTAKGEAVFDRPRAAHRELNDSFGGVVRAPLRVIDGKVTLTLLVDHSSAEVFVNDGERVITELLFPHPNAGGLTLTIPSGELKSGKLEIRPLKAAK